MISTLIIVTILNIFVTSFLPSKKELPIDTSQDILSEGISDPEWIAKEK